MARGPRRGRSGVTGSAGAGAAVAAAAIDGATRLYAIIGDPIVQVRSPQVYTAMFAEAGLNAVLVPAHVPAARFDEVVPALLALANLDGLLVTAPFKSRMLPFADSLGATASCIGALNALRREPDGTWSGDMFDGIGFVRGAERKGHRLAGAASACSALAVPAAPSPARWPMPGSPPWPSSIRCPNVPRRSPPGSPPPSRFARSPPALAPIPT